MNGETSPPPEMSAASLLGRTLAEHATTSVRLAAADRENAELRAAIAATATDVERYVADRLADARQENAELRGEVETGRAEWTRMADEHYALIGEAEGYRLARDSALMDIHLYEAERDEARAQLAAAQAQLAEARAIAGEHWDWKAGQILATRLRAALSAAPQPEPDPIGKPCTIAPSVGGPVYDRNEVRCWHEGGLWHDLAEPPASDSLARCAHGICTHRAGHPEAHGHDCVPEGCFECRPPASDEPARYCRPCGAPMSLHLDPPCRPAASGTPDGGLS